MASLLGVTAIHHAPNLDMYRRMGTTATASPAPSLSFADKSHLIALKAQACFSGTNRRNLSGFSSSAIATPNSILSEEAFSSLDGFSKDSLDDNLIDSEPDSSLAFSAADDDELAISKLHLPPSPRSKDQPHSFHKQPNTAIMLFGSTLCFLGTLLATAVAAPTDLSVIEARQSGLNNNKGNLPVGVVITKCTVPGTIALAFDDGPHEHTDRALDLLDKAGMKGTFFFNGQNYRNLVDFQSTLDRMIRDKHQIGSHTWNHPHLTTLTKSVVRAQMIKIEEHLLKMIGRYPLYMRPPFLETDARILGYLRDLDYKVISRDVETNDWMRDPPKTMAAFRKALDNGGRLVLAHEPIDETINIILPKMIEEVKKRGLKAVTVGTCLGDHSNNWYSKVVRKV